MAITSGLCSSACGRKVCYTNTIAAKTSKKSAKVAKKAAASRVASKAAKARNAVAKSSARKPRNAAAKELPAHYAVPTMH
jgi:hypothetical protein